MSLYEPKFDLDNPQHLQLRSLMAELFANHAEAISKKEYRVAEHYEAQAIGISRAAARLTDGCDCMHLASELAFSMMNLSRAALVARAAA
ncbi:hypothetical protein [Shewanella morhuae]|uniref:Uncharacterized protein n=1 Tax=Shewanella morhuae TaxID=365591 RepID=A0A380B6K0_9GAMM|nr:hypothetical protein [Shewanella morhuae]SUI93595.1 Uncharacterised protein [Shewanella morhuae]SUJ13601.1 Uncharacterised protein [Shewanella morhuae]